MQYNIRQHNLKNSAEHKQNNTIQHNPTIQHNTMLHNTTQCNIIQRNITQHHPKNSTNPRFSTQHKTQNIAIQNGRLACKTTYYLCKNTMQFKRIQFNTMQHDLIKHNDHNATQHYTSQYSTTQCVTQHNSTKNTLTTPTSSQLNTCITTMQHNALQHHKATQPYRTNFHNGVFC